MSPFALLMLAKTKIESLVFFFVFCESKVRKHTEYWSQTRNLSA